MSGENIILVEEIIVGLLLIASVVAITARQLRIPYTVGLVQWSVSGLTRFVQEGKID